MESLLDQYVSCRRDGIKRNQGWNGSINTYVSSLVRYLSEQRQTWKLIFIKNGYFLLNNFSLPLRTPSVRRRHPPSKRYPRWRLVDNPKTFASVYRSHCSHIDGQLMQLRNRAFKYLTISLYSHLFQLFIYTNERTRTRSVHKPSFCPSLPHSTIISFKKQTILDYGSYLQLSG